MRSVCFRIYRFQTVSVTHQMLASISKITSKYPFVHITKCTLAIQNGAVSYLHFICCIVWLTLIQNKEVHSICEKINKSIRFEPKQNKRNQKGICKRRQEPIVTLWNLDEWMDFWIDLQTHFCLEFNYLIGHQNTSTWFKSWNIQILQKRITHSSLSQFTWQ